MRRTCRHLAVLVLAATFGPAAASDIDYSRVDAWLARPGLDSAAGLVPDGSGYGDLQASARADVFYIHPTTGMNDDVDNVPLDDPQAMETARIMLMTQATPFNSVARVYAPRYRQAALHVFEEGEATLQEPMNRAYEDVRRAFAHYAEHDNDGRPFFLVAHSQGSSHGLRLLIEEISNSPLEARLVAAYLPGMPTPSIVFDAHLARIPPCTSPKQTGCVATWGVFAEGSRDFGNWEAVNHFWNPAAGQWRSAQGMPLVNVNPVSWREDDTPAPSEMHLGAVPFGARATHFSRVIPHLVGARTANGYTLVSPSPLPSDLFDDGGVFDEGNYHVFDIALFWADLRANARNRLVAFLSDEGEGSGPLIEGPVTATATAGQPFHLTIGLHSGPAVFGVKGLPAGLSLDPVTGVISGTPETPGSYVVTVTVAGVAGTDTAELVLMVDAA